ncbi:MAG: hypothetical protein N4A70_09210 [Pelagimonas sp.]|jgi:hypothetical protein|nr:hypothetical protein [Pelagimonas sp.]
MEMIELLEMLRENYQRQYEAAYHMNLSQHERLIPEIAFELSEGPYKRLFVVDFLAQNSGDNEVIELLPEDECLGIVAKFQHKEMTVLFSDPSWDAMQLFLDRTAERLVGFDDWFDKWIDLEGHRRVEGQLFSGVIHSVSFEEWVIEIDFGSAPTGAAMELFDLLEMNHVASVIAGPGREPQCVRDGVAS